MSLFTSPLASAGKRSHRSPAVIVLDEKELVVGRDLPSMFRMSRKRFAAADCYWTVIRWIVRERNIRFSLRQRGNSGRKASRLLADSPLFKVSLRVIVLDMSKTHGF